MVLKCQFGNGGIKEILFSKKFKTVFLIFNTNIIKFVNKINCFFIFNNIFLKF